MTGAVQPPLREAACARLRSRIVAGELKPGARLTEAPLAAALGVSRTPLREALLRLAAEGLVVAEPDRGFSVSSLTEREVREIYPMLGVLEALALEESGRLLAAAAGRLGRIGQRVARAGAPGAAIGQDTAFHEALVAHCPNRRLVAAIGALRSSIERYERLYMADQALVAQSAAQHDEIVQRIAAGDVVAAAAALREHYRFSMDAMVLMLAATA